MLITNIIIINSFKKNPHMKCLELSPICQRMLVSHDMFIHFPKRVASISGKKECHLFTIDEKKVWGLQLDALSMKNSLFQSITSTIKDCNFTTLA